MAQNLDQDFIHLGHGRLGANRPTELGFDHGERSFHVAPLVVVGVELGTVERVVMPHPVPQSI